MTKDDIQVLYQYDRWAKRRILNSKNAAPKGEPIFLTTERFEHLTRSHIEFLHILHNTIQQQEFGHSFPYSYADESKRIEWYRILSGRRDVKM